MIDINKLFYKNLTDNIVNYTILIISIIILFIEEYDQFRAWFLLLTSIFIQIFVCNYLKNCYGISIIYCFILGFLIIKYLTEKKYEKFVITLLSTLTLLFTIIYYFFEYRGNIFLKSFFIHILFLFAGFIYILIPKNKTQLNITQ